MKKEFYRHALPHFQQPGQAYFVTWCLKDSVPQKALKRYSKKLKELKQQLKSFKVANTAGAADSDPLIKENRSFSPKTAPPGLKQQYYVLRKKYIKAYDEILANDKNSKIDLSTPDNLQVMTETLYFWNYKKLENHAFCVMPNHVHWVFRLFERDEKEKSIYLQDVMNSVKRFSANQLNRLEISKGAVWQAESFDTTIRNEKHLHFAIEYTLNNPVAAGLVKKREDWLGNWCKDWVQRIPIR